MQRLQTLRSIIFIIGIFLLLFGVIMTIPIIVSLDHEWKVFSTGAIITCTFGIIFTLSGKITKLRGTPVVFIVTSSTWTVLSLFAAIPFYLSNCSYIDSLLKQYLELQQPVQRYSII